MKIIITGATGMVGSEVLRQSLMDPAIEQVTVIVRRPVAQQHPKLKTVIHKNFLDYTGLEDVFKNNDACLWCLGISQNQVSEAEYVVITYDYTVAAARAMLEANPAITFLFLSGDGASSDEKSRLLFGRVKGKAENELLRMNFKKLYLARPAGIYPVHKVEKPPFVLRMQYAIVGIMKFIVPSYVITSVKLAKTLLHIVKNGLDRQLYTYKDINLIAKNLG